MKKNNILIKKIVNIIKEKRQIIFALFAFTFYIIYYFQTKDEIILKSAVPAAVVAAAKVAGKAALAGAKTGAIKGAAQGAMNKNEDESRLKSMAKGAASGAAKGAVSGANGSLSDSAKSTLNANKNINNNSASNSSSRVDNSKSNSNESAVSNKKNNDSNKSDVDKDKTSNSNDKDNSKTNKNKDNKLPNENEEDNDEEYEEDNVDDKKTNSSKNKKKGLLIGCITILFIPLLFIPILLTIIISPLTKIFSGFDCENSASIICADKDNISFWEKSKNFFQYGSFNSTDNVIKDELDSVYDKYYDKYNVKIDIPLLLSSLLVDATEYDDQVVDEESGTKFDINDVLKKRIQYMDELAKLQIATVEREYICIYNEENKYIKEYVGLRPMEYDEDEQTIKKCSQEGEHVYDYYSALDIEGYYDRLYINSKVLKDIYENDKVGSDELIKILIKEIEENKETFNYFYTEEDAETKYGNIPAELLADINVNLSSPISGNYSITLLYGKFFNLKKHKGIDLVSDDLNIYSAGNGIVSKVYTEKLGGNVIEITHTTASGKQYVTQYAHLSKMFVSVGNNIAAGEVIGIMGSTGESTGIHLHFQMFDADNRNKTYNTVDLFPDANIL